MKTKLRLVLLLLALFSIAAAPTDSRHEISTLNQLADLFDTTAASNRMMASMFYPGTGQGEDTASAYFLLRAQVYTDVAQRVRAEIGYQFPDVLQK